MTDARTNVCETVNHALQSGNSAIEVGIRQLQRFHASFDGLATLDLELGRAGVGKQRGVDGVGR